MESTPNVIVYTVETAFGDRKFEVTTPDNPRNLQLRTRSNYWIKENMINLGVRHLLPKHWKYMCWSDCDVSFQNSNWALAAIHQLQHFSVIQPWSDCVDLDHQGAVFQNFKSFGRQHQFQIKKQKKKSDCYQYAHTGFAWCCTRTFWENAKGLMDWCPLGSGDHDMAFAMISEVETTLHGGLPDSFKRKCIEWQERVCKTTHNEVGYIPGIIKHHHHGPKKRRFYQDRWNILVENGFDPDKDIMYDHQGLIRFIGKPKLEHEINRYNLSRMEDSIESY